jgi:hypothetical protein
MARHREQGKPINVSLRVIADLSQGLYRSPADALKELISNAYDADSPKVEISFAKDFSSLVIRDWGTGMTVDEFIETMETIGGSPKRSAGAPETTSSGRKIVGRIGIGLLSVSQIARTLEIESSVKGSSIGFRASIEFDQFASEEARKIKITDLWEERKSIRIGSYNFTEIRGIDKASHFTTLKLSNLKKTIAERLTVKSEKDAFPRMMGTKLFSTSELIKWMWKNSVTKTGLHEYDRIYWELCALCPVPYIEKALRISNKIEGSAGTNDFLQFANMVNEETHLHLTVDGIECNKPILFPTSGEKSYSLFFNLLFMGGLNDESVTYKDYDRDGKPVERRFKVRGYFYFQRPKIWPPELQGLILRVRNVAVGQYDSTFMTYRRHEGFKFSQLTGEILVDELDEALNIDRSSFRETEPSFVALREAVHSYLSKVVFPGIKAYATDERVERQVNESRREKETLQRHFKKVDKKGRRVTFSENQTKIVERDDREISLALSINGEKLHLRTQSYRIIAFLESYLSRKIGSEERDDLFNELVEWLTGFE